MTEYSSEQSFEQNPDCSSDHSSEHSSDDKVINILDIFECKKINHDCEFGNYYFECKLLIDFRPFRAGYTCDVIHIDSIEHGNLVMTIDGEIFRPTWKHENSPKFINHQQ